MRIPKQSAAVQQRENIVGRSVTYSAQQLNDVAAFVEGFAGLIQVADCLTLGMILTEPLSALNSPLISRNSVVLPQPLGATRATRSPLRSTALASAMIDLFSNRHAQSLNS